MRVVATKLLASVFYQGTNCNRLFALSSFLSNKITLQTSTGNHNLFRIIGNTKTAKTTYRSMTIVRSEERIGLDQLFDTDSSTYTYLLWDKITKDAIIVDPVDIQLERDLEAVQKLNLNLIYGVNTHAHADHITGTYLLRQKIPTMKSVIATASGAKADVHINHGDKIMFGSRFVEVRATPGHTNGCVSFVADDQTFVLTGDALLLQGCGRTDFQGGSASTLYDSVWNQIFSLPDSTIIYPAHDYKGRTSGTVQTEKQTNPRLGIQKTKEEFVDIMNNLKLDYPKKIDIAVPANMRCGIPDV